MTKQHDTFQIALIQMQCKLFDPERNLDRACSFTRQAAEAGVSLVCLPEAFLTGYSIHRMGELKRFAEPKAFPHIQVLQQLAAELKILILAPFLARTDDGVSNCAILIDTEGELAGRYEKTHLIGAEKRHLIRGTRFPVWETPLGRIGCLICYDICFPETVRLLALRGAQIILAPSAWRKDSYYTEWWDLNLACRALDNLVYVAGINHAGSRFAGHTKLCDPIGRPLCESRAAREEILYGTIDLKRLEVERRNNTVLEDRQVELYHL